MEEFTKYEIMNETRVQVTQYKYHIIMMKLYCTCVLLILSPQQFVNGSPKGPVWK